MKSILKQLICAWVCCWLAVNPTVSYAQDGSQPDPTPVKQGEPAPYSGVLFSTLKAAELTARLEAQQTLCEARVKKEVDLAVSAVQLKLDNCSSSRQVLEGMYKTQIQSQREYIDFLEKKATKPKLSGEVVFIITFVTPIT